MTCPNLFAPALPSRLASVAQIPDAGLPVYPVCPHCKRELAVHRVGCGGYSINVHAPCPEHGKVSPIPSHVVNRYPALADS